MFPARLSDGLHSTLARAITLMQEILQKVRKIHPTKNKYQLEFLKEENKKVVRPYMNTSPRAGRTAKWIRCTTNMYLPGPVIRPTVPNYINRNNPNPNKLEKEKVKLENEKLKKEKQKTENLEKEIRKPENTMEEIIKYPCGHICMAALRNW